MEAVRTTANAKGCIRDLLAGLFNVLLASILEWVHMSFRVLAACWITSYCRAFSSCALHLVSPSVYRSGVMSYCMLCFDHFTLIQLTRLLVFSWPVLHVVLAQSPKNEGPDGREGHMQQDLLAGACHVFGGETHEACIYSFLLYIMLSSQGFRLHDAAKRKRRQYGRHLNNRQSLSDRRPQRAPLSLSTRHICCYM